MSEENKIINANPTKKFFIDMLVRDIALEPAIAELVDNSLDGVKKFRKKYNYDEACSIEVSFDKDQFTISDTCGGISIADARDYCFRFGRDSERDFELSDGTGVFGIGMKRALFRMGKVFDIQSITPEESFSIHIDVDEWIKDKNENWTFQFSEMNVGKNDPKDCGTFISVSQLHEPIKNSFTNPYFRDSFFGYVQRRCSIIKDLNVSVVINEKNILYKDQKILFSRSFKPFVKSYEVDGVKTKIIAGCAKLGEPKNAGWYIQCNGRMILFANQGEETGWGTDDIRPFHVEFAAFRGYVLFESSDLEKLPWNTTKTGVDASSKYYHKALDEMKECERIFISWRKKLNEFLRDNEEINADLIFEGDEKEIMSAEIAAYAQDNYQFVFPELTSVNFPVPAEPVTRISFKVEKKKVDEIKSYFGKVRMNNKEIGEKIFEYFYEREIEEDE